MRLRPDLWLLDPDVVHLNHGSFGAVPVPVMEAQRQAAADIERSPERFYRSDLAPAIDAVRERTAAFLGTDPVGLVLVQNATEAVQVALSAVELRAGSEIILTDHAYGWVKAAVQRACRASGAVTRYVALPDSSDDLAASLSDAVVAALSPRTALVILDQITSSSARLLPVAEVIAAVAANTDRDVPVLIDGAHGPGLITNPVPAGATFWLGNLHKWAFSARTAAALVVSPDFRDRVAPLVASAGASAGYPRSFSYLGTQDPTAYLALPTALDFPETHLGVTFEDLRERNSAVLAQGLARLTERLGVEPATDNGLPLRTVALGVAGTESDADEWTTRLRREGVEVAVTSFGGGLHARVSVQAYVALDDFDRLGQALARRLGVRY